MVGASPEIRLLCTPEHAQQWTLEHAPDAFAARVGAGPSPLRSPLFRAFRLGPLRARWMCNHRAMSTGRRIIVDGETFIVRHRGKV